VQECYTEAEAEEFVVRANGWAIETVRRNTTKQRRILAEYRGKLIRLSRRRGKP
jgi:hypothetical protein